MSLQFGLVNNHNTGFAFLRILLFVLWLSVVTGRYLRLRNQYLRSL